MVQPFQEGLLAVLFAGGQDGAEGAHVVEVGAQPGARARHAHLELRDTPVLDKGFYLVLGNDELLLRALGRPTGPDAPDTADELLAILEAPDADDETLIEERRMMRGVLDLARRVAPLDVTVLLRGESGTGKELASRAIHYLGSRRDSPRTWCRR